MKIAIDGPAGAGKSTLARTLARRLGVLYIDTGAMYRALTVKALDAGTDLDDEDAVADLARRSSIDLDYLDGEITVRLDGRDVTEEIRSPRISEHVSRVAAFPAVRAIMVEKQREMAANRHVVMDGRDIGECVLPDADFKFFVTASLDARARRRAEELAAKGYEIDYEALRREVAERDRLDSQREVGALRVLPDSIVIDTSDMDPEQVLDAVLKVIWGG